MVRKRNPDKLPRDIERWRIEGTKLKHLDRKEVIAKIWRMDAIERKIFEEPVKLERKK